MADPPTGAPEPLATTTTRRGTGIDVTENLARTTTVRTRRHTRVESKQTHAAPEPVELTNTGTSTRRAAVTASTDNPQPRETRRQTDKDKNYVRIST
ncbi:unnamed protein product [Penicillium camemberti]|uniref:Str. FM013 n=1 Tax=Penicillium camemberti (strain FM 013) TaxID=1429867 RepID=A0A0G4PWW3_PENC3|nr:unnamed protein product [Penicillium camemberti]